MIEYINENGKWIKDDNGVEMLIEPSEKWISENNPLKPISEIKLEKIAELSKICNETILFGFDSTVKYGESKHFTLDLEDQQNMDGYLNIIANGLQVPIMWKSSDMLVADAWTIEEFKQFYTEAALFKLQTIQKYHNLRAYIMDSNRTQEEIDVITWDTDLNA